MKLKSVIRKDPVAARKVKAEKAAKRAIRHDEILREKARNARRTIQCCKCPHKVQVPERLLGVFEVARLITDAEKKANPYRLILLEEEETYADYAQMRETYGFYKAWRHLAKDEIHVYRWYCASCFASHHGVLLACYNQENDMFVCNCCGTYPRITFSLPDGLGGEHDHHWSCPKCNRTFFDRTAEIAYEKLCDSCSK